MLVLLRQCSASRNLFKLLRGTWSAEVNLSSISKPPCFRRLGNSQIIASTSVRWYYSLPSTPPDVKTIISKIEWDMGKRHRIGQEEANALLNALKSSTSILPSQSLIAIECFGKKLCDIKPENRIEMVQNVWSEMQRMQCSVQTAHFNALLNVFLENEYPFCEENFIKTIEESNLEPDQNTYQMLLESRCRKGDMDGALDLMMTMKGKGYPLTRAIIRALIVCYGEQGDLEGARNQIQKMPGIGLQPNARTYVSLLCVYGKYGEIQLITEQIQRCKAEGMPISPKSYLDIIYSLCVNGYSQHVHAVIKDIERSYELHQHIINLILQLAMKGLDVAVIDVLTSKSFYYADKSMYLERAKAFIRLLVKTKRPLANQLNNCETVANLGLGHQAYLSLIRATAEHGSTDDTLTVLRGLHKRKVKLTQGYFEHLFPASDAKTIELMRILKEEFDFRLNAKFLRDHVVPHLEMKDTINTVHNFRQVYASQYAASSSVVYECLRRNQLKEAAQLTTLFKAHIPTSIMGFPLISAIKNTKDFSSYSKFIQNIQKNYSQPCLDRVDDANPKPPIAEAIGFILYNTITTFPVDTRPDALQQILPDFISFNIKITSYHAQRIRKALGADLTEQTDTFLRYITIEGEILPANRELASVLGEEKSIANVSTGIRTVNWDSDKPINIAVAELNFALKANNVDLLQKVYNNLHCSVTDQLSQSMLISILNVFGNANLLDEAKQIMLQLLRSSKSLVIPNLLGFMHKFGGKGDVESIEEFGKYLTPKQKINVSFNANLAYAYFVCGRGADLLNVFSKQLDDAKSDEEISNLKHSFPGRRLLFVLDRNVFLNQKFELLAQKYAEKNLLMPYYVLFWHYFIDRNVKESQRIWNDYLKSEVGFHYGPILAVARTKFDVLLVHDLIEFLKKSDIHKGRLQGPYSCLLEIYMDRGMTDMALKTLEEARDHCLLDSIHKNTLRRLQRVAITAGKTFLYEKYL